MRRTLPFDNPAEAVLWAFRQAFHPDTWPREPGAPRAVSPALVLGLLLDACRDDAELGQVVRWAFGFTRYRPHPADSEAFDRAMRRLGAELWAHGALPPSANPAAQAALAEMEAEQHGS